MRLRFWAPVLIGIVLVVGQGGGPALAQFEDLRSLFGYRNDPPPRPVRPRDPYAARGYYQAYPPPPAYRGPYYPGMPVNPEARRPYYDPEEREVRRPIRPRREARRPASSEPSERRRRPRPVPSAPARAAPEKPEVEPSTFVVVFGDSLADLVAQGLEDAYDETAEVEIVDKTKGDSGLSRAETYDWPKAIQDYLATNPRITVAVMMLGANDHQAIREGDALHEPLSDRWRELYRDRIDAVAQAFADRKIPLVWVGAPPMKNDKLSADLIVINEMYRDRVQRVGGVYVDVWQGFVNNENRYAVMGPDVEGQTARLRTNDGVAFTPAGARKAAHFVEVELKRLIEQKAPGTAVASLPKASDAPGSGQAVDQIINASIPALPEPPGLPSLPAKPPAGPVLPLTRTDASPNGALVSGRPKLEGDAAGTIDRALKQGVASPPKPGRADDFTWPPKS